MGSRGLVETTHPRYIDIDALGRRNWTLQQTEEYLRTLDHEEAYVFDANNKMMYGLVGGKDSVGIPKEIMDLQGVTVTHSHPTGDAGFGGTLSINVRKNPITGKNEISGDIPVFARAGWKEMRATASGRGEMNYILRKGANARAQTFSNVMKGRMNTLERNMSSTYQKTISQLRKAGNTKSLATIRTEARQKSVGILNKAYKKTAAKYGIEYITRKTPYNYNR